MLLVHAGLRLRPQPDCRLPAPSGPPVRLARSGSAAAARTLRRLRLDQRGQRLLETILPPCDSSTRSCGRFGPARLGSTVRKIELQQLGVLRLRRLLVVEQALLAAVGLDQRNLFFASGR